MKFSTTIIALAAVASSAMAVVPIPVKGEFPFFFSFLQYTTFLDLSIPDTPELTNWTRVLFHTSRLPEDRRRQAHRHWLHPVVSVDPSVIPSTLTRMSKHEQTKKKVSARIQLYVCRDINSFIYSTTHITKKTVPLTTEPPSRTC